MLKVEGNRHLLQSIQIKLGTYSCVSKLGDSSKQTACIQKLPQISEKNLKQIVEIPVIQKLYNLTLYIREKHKLQDQNV